MHWYFHKRRVYGHVGDIGWGRWWWGPWGGVIEDSTQRHYSQAPRFAGVELTELQPSAALAATTRLRAFDAARTQKVCVAGKESKLRARFKWIPLFDYFFLILVYCHKLGHGL